MNGMMITMMTMTMTMPDHDPNHRLIIFIVTNDDDEWDDDV